MNKIFMNKMFMQFCCFILSTSMALGTRENNPNKGSITDHLFTFISHNPRLLKIAGLMSLTTLCLYCCYRYKNVEKKSTKLKEHPKKSNTDLVKALGNKAFAPPTNSENPEELKEDNQSVIPEIAFQELLPNKPSTKVQNYSNHFCGYENLD